MAGLAVVGMVATLPATAAFAVKPEGGGGGKPPQSRISFQNTTVTVDEDTGTAEIDLMRWGDLTTSATIDCVTVDNASPGEGDATAGADYTSGSATALFDIGSRFATCSIPIEDDLRDELTEDFSVVMANSSGPSFAKKATVSVVIVDDDSAGAFNTEADFAAPEDFYLGYFIFRVTLTENPAGREAPASVSYTTEDGSAAGGSSCLTDGVDYLTRSGTLVFPPLTTYIDVQVPICDDSVDEPDQTFSLVLSSPVNATIGDGLTVATIQDNDEPPTISVNDAEAWEDEGPVTFIVGLSQRSEFPVTVDYLTWPTWVEGPIFELFLSSNPAFGGASCEAFGPIDYVATSGTLTFAPGETTKSVDVTLCDDLEPETGGPPEFPDAEIEPLYIGKGGYPPYPPWPEEMFTLGLENPTNASILDGEGTGTIKDDEPAFVMVSLGNEGGPINLLGEPGGMDFPSFDAALGDSVTETVTFFNRSGYQIPRAIDFRMERWRLWEYGVHEGEYPPAPWNILWNQANLISTDTASTGADGEWAGQFTADTTTESVDVFIVCLPSSVGGCMWFENDPPDTDLMSGYDTILRCRPEGVFIEWAALLYWHEGEGLPPY